MPLSTSVSTLLRSRNLRVISMTGDSNCFYRAIATSYYKDVAMHHLIRRIAMEHMLDEGSYFEHFFESKTTFLRRVVTNKQLGVWNSDMADIVPLVIVKLLNCCLEIYSVSGENIQLHRFGEGPTIRLLQNGNHYDLLMKD